MGKKMSTPEGNPWLDGHYKCTWHLWCGEKVEIAVVIGENVEFQSIVLYNAIDAIVRDDTENTKVLWRAGTFKEVDQEVMRITDQKNYTMQMINSEDPLDEMFGFVSKRGKNIIFKTKFGMAIFDWIETSEINALREQYVDEFDNYRQPLNHYELKPNEIGKVVWISGAAGFGKSATAKRLMETANFVYFEGDCFMAMKNPYIGPGSDDSMEALFKQKWLVGVPRTTQKVLMRGGFEWKKFRAGEDYDLTELYTEMCGYIQAERHIIGGDWVVAHAVPSRIIRDVIRSNIGSDVTFFVIDSDKALALERLGPRLEAMDHNLVEAYTNTIDKYELAGDDEVNAFNIKVTRDNTVDDVVQMILTKL